MNPAADIIKRFGGNRRIAALLGVHEQTPAKWKQRRGLGGTGGMIPQRHHQKLLLAAREQDIRLDHADFYCEAD